MSDARLDRARGAFLGLAIGDALGVPLEFSARDAHPAVTGMIGGGPFGLAPGEWTDDTSMAICLAQSLLERGELDPADLMQRFLRWWRTGHNSVTGTCFDIGNTTLDALARFERTQDPMAGRADPAMSGNGSIMRLAPLAIFAHRDHDTAVSAARTQSMTTHAAPEAVDACALLAVEIADLIHGRPFRSRPWSGEPSIVAIANWSWQHKAREQISSSGYVVHTLEAAWWAVGTSRSFEEALIKAVNLADDSDTVGAVAGQLAGARWGAAAIPESWASRLAWRDLIDDLAVRLYASNAP